MGLGSNAVIKVIVGKTEKIFTDLYKAKSYYTRMFRQGREPKIIRISEREKTIPDNCEDMGASDG